MEPIILELYNRGRWWDAAEVTIAYLNDYIASSLAYEARDNSACSVNAPMKADPEMVTRLFTWGRDVEQGGIVDYRKVADALKPLCEPEALLNYLGELAAKMVDLPDRLRRFECPEEILDFPSIGFHNSETKLIRMGVLSE